MPPLPQNIRVEQDQNLSVITLERGKANALNAGMIEELCSAVERAAADPGVRGIVLASGRERFFSSGFDIREVFGYDRGGMAAFFGRFIDLYESLYICPKPVVGALSGHVYAGGAILALACDHRVMAEGDFGFAVNEINLGLALPPGIRRMLVDAVGVGRAREILLFGAPVVPARALEIGLVNELAPAGEVLARALERARTLAGKPPNAFAAIKRSLRESGGPFGGDRAVLDLFVERWFSAEAAECRRAIASMVG